MEVKTDVEGVGAKGVTVILGSRFNFRDEASAASGPKMSAAEGKTPRCTGCECR